MYTLSLLPCASSVRICVCVCVLYRLGNNSQRNDIRPSVAKKSSDLSTNTNLLCNCVLFYVVLFFFRFRFRRSVVTLAHSTSHQSTQQTNPHPHSTHTRKKTIAGSHRTALRMRADEQAPLLGHTSKAMTSGGGGGGQSMLLMRTASVEDLSNALGDVPMDDAYDDSDGGVERRRCIVMGLQKRNPMKTSMC